MMRLGCDPIQSTSSGEAIWSVSFICSENVGAISVIRSSPRVQTYICKRIIELSA